MISMIILFLVVLLLFCISLIFSYKNLILSPQVGFAGGFLISVGYGLFWVGEYGIDLSLRALALLVFGISLFVIVCIVSQIIFSRMISGGSLLFYGNSSEGMYIESWKMIVFACFQVVTLVLLFRFLHSLDSSSISAAIFKYRYANTFTENKIEMPKYISLFRKICNASTFFWGYYLAHTIIYKKKTNIILLLVNVGLGLINNIILGARTGAFVVIVSFITLFYFFLFIKTKKRIGLKTICAAVLILVLLLASFKMFGNILGRNISFSFSEYIAIYLSAEIKNFNTFVNSTSGGADLYKCQTLIYIVNFISGKFGFPNWYHELDIPFFYYNNHNLGNVSTIFYAFYYDGGVKGIAIFTIIMAVFSSYMYIKAIKQYTYYRQGFSFIMLVYSYMYFCFLFSFFSNKFYEHIFNLSFIWFILTWIILDVYVNKIKLRVIKICFNYKAYLPR